jgi:hypothetical protein
MRRLVSVSSRFLSTLVNCRGEDGLRVTDTGTTYQLYITRRYGVDGLENLDPYFISLGGCNFNILNREWFSYH